MSAVTNLSSVSPAALPPINLHGHGHKHGSHVESTDASADSTSNDALGQAPAGSTQNLFGTLLQSLEQVIGLQPSTTTPAATASTTTPATTAATPAATASATTSASATTASAAGGTSATQQQQSTLLQNYLNNLSHKAQADGSQSPKVAGSSISTNA
jgi:hypothetical protein